MCPDTCGACPTAVATIVNDNAAKHNAFDDDTDAALRAARAGGRECRYTGS